MVERKYSIKKQKKKPRVVDRSSIIKVLNEIGADVDISGNTIIFKTRKRNIIKDLHSLANTYNPLIKMNLHECAAGKYCSTYHYYFLRVNINPQIHMEASQALYEFLNKYSKTQKRKKNSDRK